MKVRVSLFGRAAEQARVREVALELGEGATMRDALAGLVELRPQLEWLGAGSRPARNLEYVSWDDLLEDGDEISFIPPVSGGRQDLPSADPPPISVAIQDKPLEMAPLVAFVERPEAGAVVTFSGNVRKESRGRKVEYLEYDAHRPMAEKKMREIAAEAVRRWDCRIAIRHRVGRLEIGEASVMVAVSCAHRAEALAACRFAIDTLKETVPIWKKEVWEGGEVWIEGEGVGEG